MSKPIQSLSLLPSLFPVSFFEPQNGHLHCLLCPTARIYKRIVSAFGNHHQQSFSFLCQDKDDTAERERENYFENEKLSDLTRANMASEEREDANLRGTIDQISFCSFHSMSKYSLWVIKGGLILTNIQYEQALQKSYNIYLAVFCILCQITFYRQAERQIHELNPQLS